MTDNVQALKSCDVPACERLPRTPLSKWCELHYGRLRRHGSLDLPLAAKDLPCVVKQCEANANGRDGYCGKHRERVRRHGDPDVELLIHGDPERRFRQYVEKLNDGCWRWTSTLAYDGYGLFGANGHRTGAHRWSWFFTHGEFPPPGLHLDHLCRRRDCVNPAHLEPVTPAENERRKWEVIRGA